MKKLAIIYPNQLFETKYLPYNTDIIDYFIIIEDPLFFSDQERKLNFNLLKLIYQRATMKYYQSYLLSHNKKVRYIAWNKEPNTLFKYIKKKFGVDNELYIIDPIDKLLESRIKIFSKKLKQKIIYHDSPSFLLTNNDLELYIKKFTSSNDNKSKIVKKYFQYNFYIWHRKYHNILMDKNNKPIGGKYSYDKYNRNALPKKNFHEFVINNKIKYLNKKYNNDYYSSAIDYCEKTFKNYYTENYRPENIYLYPITHNDSKKHFREFLKYKLKYFSNYQDAIDFNEVSMFHSVISPQLNNGLLTPLWVLTNITTIINNKLLKDIEGFVRQLNWREYSRLLYRYAYNAMTKNNYFHNTRHLNEKWYNGKTGIEPIDKTINMAFQYGYLHHIMRLMIMCNFMNLCMINPNDVYKWFMEFSLDSYDWVMVNNVYSMGLYADGGMTTTKPYISSSNYILKMSNAEKDDFWEIIWNILYYYFIFRNYSKLKGRGKIYKANWNKQTHKKKNN